MNYYKDIEGNLYADPASADGLDEVLSPVRADGTILPNHKFIGQLALQEDGTRYTYYLEEPVDGVYQPDVDKITSKKTEQDSADVKTRIDEIIQSEINNCNDSTSWSFDNADAFAKYAINPNSDKQTVSLVFIEWIDSVWTACRACQEKIANGEYDYPDSVEDFIALAELPEIGEY